MNTSRLPRTLLRKAKTFNNRVVSVNVDSRKVNNVGFAAIDMNHQDPIAQYLTCRAEMSKDRKGYKTKVKAIEYDAKKILYLESILADYIDG